MRPLCVKMLAGDYPGPGDSLSLIRPRQSATVYTWVVMDLVEYWPVATEPPYVCSRLAVNKIFSDRKVLLLLNISLIKLVIFILKIENTSF